MGKKILLSKQDKIKIFTEMKMHIENRKAKGFCYALILSMNKYFPENWLDIEDIPELMKHCPQEWTSLYWFPLTADDRDKRLKILSDEIELLSNE